MTHPNSEERCATSTTIVGLLAGRRRTATAATTTIIHSKKRRRRRQQQQQQPNDDAGNSSSWSSSCVRSSFLRPPRLFVNSSSSSSFSFSASSRMLLFVCLLASRASVGMSFAPPSSRFSSSMTRRTTSSSSTTPSSSSSRVQLLNPPSSSWMLSLSSTAAATTSKAEEYASPSPSPSSKSTTTKTTTTSTTLPNHYPKFANILTANGYIAPTPIQQSSAPLAKDGENLLLIAATGSGKTLAYLLPALSRAATAATDHGRKEEEGRRRTVLIVAPTRELAAQLARDASLLLPDDANINDDDDMPQQAQPQQQPLPNVLLAVRGIPPPTPQQLSHATVLVGTPDELHAVLTRISGAQNFIAGNVLLNVVLDEVDVLLPPAPKNLRTAFDTNHNSARGERTTQERKRKLRAAQRRGVEFHGGSSIKGRSIDRMDLTDGRNGAVLTPTERVLRLIASARYVGYGGGDEEEEEGEREASLQLLAGSATASRATLDRLNRALRWAALEGGVVLGTEGLEGVWKGRMKVCRPAVTRTATATQGAVVTGENNDAASQASSNNDALPEEEDATTTHTIRAVTVPSAVTHNYVPMTKDAVLRSHEILSNVARYVRKYRPRTSLVFICGEFGRSIAKEKKREAPSKIRGNTSRARRNAKRRRVFLERQKSREGGASNNGGGNGGGGPEPLSVRKACSTLQSMGVDAHPMHVVLGLEPNAAGGGGGGGAGGEDNDGGSTTTTATASSIIMSEGEEKEKESSTTDNVEEADEDEEVELPPVLVTFEGSARGLHFDGVDAVFVVGRPASAASYLHLAGRVGRAVSSSSSAAAANHGSTNDDDGGGGTATGEVEVRPGTIVSFCSKGRLTELEKWTGQVGAVGLEEIAL